MTAADAYALASWAVDLGVGEAVDVVNLVYAKIPRTFFEATPAIGAHPLAIMSSSLRSATLNGT